VESPERSRSWILWGRGPNKKVHHDDFIRVTKFLCDKSDLDIDKASKTADGTAYVRFGSKRGAGTVQLYLTGRSISAGNCLIQIGENEGKRAQLIRETLLRSAWFTVIGIVGKKAMTEYATRSGLGEGHKFHDVIGNTFKE
jgi:hypothetical protein